MNPLYCEMLTMVPMAPVSQVRTAPVGELLISESAAPWWAGTTSNSRSSRSDVRDKTMRGSLAEILCLASGVTQIPTRKEIHGFEQCGLVEMGTDHQQGLWFFFFPLFACVSQGWIACWQPKPKTGLWQSSEVGNPTITPAPCCPPNTTSQFVHPWRNKRQTVTY